MRRTPAVLAVLLLGLAACDQSPSRSDSRGAGSANYVTTAAPASAQKPAPPQPAGAAKLAYSHQFNLEMAPAMVEPRFERARDACLKEPALGCVLLSAKFSSGNDNPGAGLVVRLPHGQVEAFEQSVLAPLPDETAGTATVLLRSTEAEDLTQALLDADRRLSELTQYRDRLIDLAKHTDAKVEDLIKVESELATTQSQIEALVAQQQHLNDQVATEKLTIDLYAHQTIGEPGNPIVRVWHDSARILSENVADALRATIETLPWLVPIVLLLQVLRLLWRFLRRRR
jgi:Domain of unknown function (DUF4349)